MVPILLAVLLQAENPTAILEGLEPRARAVRTIHAEFTLQRLPGAAAVRADLDLAGQRFLISFSADGKTPSLHNLLTATHRYRWKPGEPGTRTNVGPFYGDMGKGLNEVLASLDGAADPAKNGDAWRVGLGVDLEGKPAKDEFGAFRIYSSFGTTPFRWLGLLREEKELKLSGDDRRWTFRIPARRKTVVVDRESGFLQSIETADYDGTLRSVVCRSFVLNGVLPEFPTPPKCREIPMDREELDEVLGGRRRLIGDLLAAVVRRWDAVVKADRRTAVAEAYLKEMSGLAALWHEVRLHQMAAAVIRQRMDSGASWQSLEKEAEADAGSFAALAREQGEKDRDFLRNSFAKLSDSLSDLFREQAPKGSDPAEFLKLLRSAVDFDAVWNRQLRSDPKRPAEVYREELEHARQI
ncbi:MAG: hypothetical protein HY293_10795 [Planctomycetes bacterium]|nr:hypothetical protein [Planctomycetota bacterium]